MPTTEGANARKRKAQRRQCGRQWHSEAAMPATRTRDPITFSEAPSGHFDELVNRHRHDEGPHPKPLHGIVEVRVLVCPEQQVVLLVAHGEGQLPPNPGLVVVLVHDVDGRQERLRALLMVPRAGVLREVFRHEVDELIPVGLVLQPRVLAHEVGDLPLFEDALDSHPLWDLRPRGLVQAVHGQVPSVHEERGAILQAQGSHDQVPWVRVAAVVAAGPRPYVHLLGMVEHATHLHDAVHIVLHLVPPREGAGGDDHLGHGQPRPPQLDQLPLPLHPVELPDAEAVYDTAEAHAHGQQLPLLVAADAELPVPDHPRDRAGHRVRQAHQADDD
mmetsp:Transcript_32842/g.94336  ORF Transcript_32842/g.94336 Transcript_32842/m.94336 type:complete len:331 (-) Transcript_32842:676-1668(-)